MASKTTPGRITAVNRRQQTSIASVRAGPFQWPLVRTAQIVAPQPAMFVGGFTPPTTTVTQTLVVGSGSYGNSVATVVSVEYESVGESDPQPAGDNEPAPLPQGSDQADGWTHAVGEHPR